MCIRDSTCVSRSRLNVNAAKNKGCIGREEGNTGESFHHARRFVETWHPPVVVLENLHTLMEKERDAELSDAETVEKCLQEAGYAGRWFHIEASDYGSFCVRRRIYYVGFLGSKAEHEQRLEIIDQCLVTMLIAKDCQILTKDDFFLSTSELDALS
eukprot:1469869-Alexandrium_andersonii.AAC.1